MNCPHCGSSTPVFMGIQIGYEYPSRLEYTFDIYNCDNGCGSSFGTEKKFTGREYGQAKEAVCNG
jgi:hypothetical protein